MELLPTTLDNIKALREKLVELNCWLDKEDMIWNHRSSVGWLQARDRNTRFFHSRASSRYMKSLIEGFFDDNDIWQDDIEQVDKNVKNSYSNLFTTSHSSELTKLVDAIKPKVSQAMNNDLTSNFHASNIKSPSRNVSLQSLGAKQNASYALSTLQAYN